MTIKEELTRKIAELQEQVDAIKDEPLKVTGRFKPKLDEVYWCLLSNGETVSTTHTGITPITQYSVWLMGNMYKTKADAVEARSKQLALVRVNDRIDELNAEQDWVADYSIENQQCKHHISTVTQCGDISSNRWFTSTPTSMFNVGTIETVNTLISEMDADIKTAIGWKESK